MDWLITSSEFRVKSLAVVYDYYGWVERKYLTTWVRGRWYSQPTIVECLREKRKKYRLRDDGGVSC